MTFSIIIFYIHHHHHTTDYYTITPNAVGKPNRPTVLGLPQSTTVRSHSNSSDHHHHHHHRWKWRYQRQRWQYQIRNGRSLTFGSTSAFQCRNVCLIIDPKWLCSTWTSSRACWDLGGSIAARGRPAWTIWSTDRPTMRYLSISRRIWDVCHYGHDWLADVVDQIV